MSAAIMQNLPALPVIIPLLMAAIIAMFRHNIAAWLLATIAVWSSFLVCFSLVALAGNVPFLSYEMGGHAPPYGIEYRLDDLNGFMLLLVSFMGAIMMPFAGISVQHEITKGKQHLFYCMFLLCFAGLLGILSTNDIFNVYVFLEISSLAMYTLIGMGRDKRALAAAYEYLILGTLGATFILIGIGLLYIMTGTLNITDMAQRLPDALGTTPVEAAFAFLTLGIALKVAAFPLHIWLTNAYAYAPSFISAFLASTAAKVSLYLGIRLFFGLFGIAFSFHTMPLTEILMVFGIAGMLVGSLTAIYQKNVKRMLAFSSVAQMSYIFIGIALATEAGLTASLTHIANHALSKGALFLAIGAVFYRVGGVRIEHFKGMGRKMPITMGCFVLAGLSLIGVPGTAGFISKWQLITALLQAGWWPVVILVLVSSLLAVMYIWQVIEVAYFRTAPKKLQNTQEAPLLMLLPILLLALSNIWFGLNTDLTLGLAQQAATAIFAGGN